jgi:beta-lactamase superfamily II metal-dependent hydrolase
MMLLDASPALGRTGTGMSFDISGRVGHRMKPCSRTELRLFAILLLSLALALGVPACGCTPPPSQTGLGPEPLLSGAEEPALATSVSVHFLNVGQGDSILIRTSPGFTVLIDGGPQGAGPGVVSYLRARGVTGLDLVIASHPHADHIGGLPGVLAAFQVSRVIDAGVPHTSDLFSMYLSAVEAQIEAGHCTYETPAGQLVALAGNVTLAVLGPEDEMNSLNNSSVVCRLDFDEVSFLFPGDAELEAETGLLAGEVKLAADVLKVGHHGSLTSTSPAFLGAVSPDYAVICVGRNTFGHPTQAVVDRLRAAGAVIFRTDTAGDLIFTTDGKKLQVTGSPWSRLPVEPVELFVIAVVAGGTAACAA